MRASRRSRPDLPAAGRATAPGRRSAGSPGGRRRSSPFSTGISVRRPTPQHCGALGAALARLHWPARDFRWQRPNALSVDGWRPSVRRPRGRGRQGRAGPRRAHAARSSPTSSGPGRRACRAASSMPTSSPTTCSSSARTVSGLIDFYFACTDAFAYDLAICLNAWCFEADGSFNVTKGRAMIAGYQTVRPPRRRRESRRCRCSAAARRCASC